MASFLSELSEKPSVGDLTEFVPERSLLSTKVGLLYSSKEHNRITKSLSLSSVYGNQHFRQTYLLKR
jgi:hypothetical protein